MILNRCLYRSKLKILFSNRFNKLLLKRHIINCKIDNESNTIEIYNKRYLIDDYTNVPYYMPQYIGRNLYLKPGNPIYLITEGIKQFFPEFQVFQFEDPVVDIESNFDSLLIHKDHVSRTRSQSYYVNRDYLLRTHTSAHQTQCLRANAQSFVCIADVYRRDEIDDRHFCVFHQCELFQRLHINSEQLRVEGIEQIFDKSQPLRSYDKQEYHSLKVSKVVEKIMKSRIEAYLRNLLGKDLLMRWVDAYFPFTHPSWELEIYNNERWLEILGCGIVEQQLLNNTGHSDCIGWALGFGLERLAMLRYKIPSVRLFWRNDKGFLIQFENAKPDDNIVYKPISDYPAIIFDISFWLPSVSSFTQNDLHETIRAVGGELVEFVKLVDEYKDKTGKQSLCYRISYRSYERELTKEEVHVMHKQVGTTLKQKFNVLVRDQAIPK